LLIPQLILSGVVVKFDKLNPAIGNSETVPFVGDLMASRWAFEAAMVSQFKENQYEREFYLYDKIMANSDFKKVYFVPELETKLQYCLSNYTSADPEAKSKVARDLEVIYNEIKRESEEVGHKEIDWITSLSPTKFDSEVYVKAYDFLENLKRVYIKRYNNADKLKEKKIEELTNTPEKERQYTQFKDQYHNETISEIVKNISESHRIIERDGKLIQKIYPIYKDPDPEHVIDFDAQFYMPSKHFLNKNIDTFYFNIGVIWSMSLVMGLLLYFEVLRKVVDGISNLSTPVSLRRK
jgi:hypothetical protein